jgi:hypothetical protein
MGNEPLWLLFERMRKALAEAARVSERATERVKELETSGVGEKPAKNGAGPDAAGPPAKPDGQPE